MAMLLTELASKLKSSSKKVQLIYAFNGNGKTRLSREFKLLIDKKEDSNGEEIGLEERKIIYYNAFTEDLFYWDNDLENKTEPKLRIHPNSFTKWIFEEQGQDINIIENFQEYTNKKITPKFGPIGSFDEVIFSFRSEDDNSLNNIKISKGEESLFVWCIFYSLIWQIIEILNELEQRDTNQFDKLEYIFIDDPVSSLDDNNLIELAVNISELVKYSRSNLKFIITTHNPLFFNILDNELKRDDNRYIYKEKKGKSYKAKRDFSKYQLKKQADETFLLDEQSRDSPFAYPLFLKSEIEKAIETGEIKKYHFNFLRNIFEKTSTFLGYEDWIELLPTTEDGQTEPYVKRLVNAFSHSKHSGEEVAELSPQDKETVKFLLKHLVDKHNFWKEE